MKKTDERINVSIVSPKTTILNIIFLILYSVLLLSIYANIDYTQENAYVLAGATLALIVVSSIGMAVAVGHFRYVRSILPMLRLADAAREVARGNYAVRIPPYRKDGKIDEIEALYEDFNGMVEELGSTELLKTSFVSNISHELKTPISVISNYSALLLDEKISDEEKKQYADKINKTSHELAELIGNILQISKLDNQQVEAKCEAFDLSEMLIQSILSFDMLLDEKNIDLQIRIPEGVPVVSDRGLLKIVFHNLFSNAVKFTENEGEIEVGLRQNAGETVFYVRDNGCGMDEKSVKHIFDKFYQADKAHSAKGNGLGMTMVKQIVSLLGGTIDIQSFVGEGSLFTISLPNSVS